MKTHCDVIPPPVVLLLDMTPPEKEKIYRTRVLPEWRQVVMMAVNRK